METRIVIADEKESQIAEQGRGFIAEAKAFAIVRDDEHRDAALAFNRRVKTMRGLVGELYDEPIDKAHKLHKMLCEKRNALDGPLADADKAVRRSLGTYEDNKRAVIEAARRAEEAKQREEVARLERERQAEINRLRKIAEDKRLAEAAALEAAGKKAQAEALVAAPVYVVVPSVAPPPIVNRTPIYEAPKGTSTRVNWKHRIIDVDLIPREWMIPNDVKIGAHVRANHESHGIPGVDAYSEANAIQR